MGQTNRGRIQAISLVDQVTKELREGIIDGTLAAGQSVSITRLAGEMHVSHIPVREALRRLESEGLIALRPGHGATITPLRSEDVRSIYRIRRWIEPELAALSAPMVTDADLTKLGECLTVFRGGSIEEEIPIHKQFHFLLLRSAASEWDVRILEYLWNANERYARLIFQPSTEAHQKHLETAHATLRDAIVSKDPMAIRTSLLEHLEENERALLAALTPSDLVD